MISQNVELQTGRTITWGDPANPDIGIIKAISQNQKIFFMMRISPDHDQTLYTTIERREILGVVDDPI